MVNFTPRVWIRNLLRPKLSHVKVILYEKNAEKQISEYDLQRQLALMKAIQDLWGVPKGTPYHFEAELYEVRSCFKKNQPPTLILSCYEEGKWDPMRKKSMNIPIRYRSKFLGKFHKLTPDQVGSTPWPELEVKFVLDL